MSKDMLKESLPHDGWRSRKIIIGLALVASILGAGFVCMFIKSPGADAPVATFDQWKSLAAMVTPSIVVPLFAALGIDKLAEAKAQK